MATVHRAPRTAPVARVAELAQRVDAALRIGSWLGIGTGAVVARCTGTQQRATCSCIGDTANVVARLEEHTRLEQRGILMDEAPRSELPSGRVLEALAPVALKRKAAPTLMFAVQRPTQRALFGRSSSAVQAQFERTLS